MSESEYDEESPSDYEVGSTSSDIKTGDNVNTINSPPQPPRFYLTYVSFVKFETNEDAWDFWFNYNFISFCKKNV